MLDQFVGIFPDILFVLLVRGTCISVVDIELSVLGMGKKEYLYPGNYLSCLGIIFFYLVGELGAVFLCKEESVPSSLPSLPELEGLLKASSVTEKRKG